MTATAHATASLPFSIILVPLPHRRLRPQCITGVRLARPFADPMMGVASGLDMGSRCRSQLKTEHARLLTSIRHGNKDLWPQAAKLMRPGMGNP